MHSGHMGDSSFRTREHFRSEATVDRFTLQVSLSK